MLLVGTDRRVYWYYLYFRLLCLSYFLWHIPAVLHNCLACYFVIVLYLAMVFQNLTYSYQDLVWPVFVRPRIALHRVLQYRLLILNSNTTTWYWFYISHRGICFFPSFISYFWKFIEVGPICRWVMINDFIVIFFSV